MSEKTTLLPSAPTDERFVTGASGSAPPPQAHEHAAIPMPRLVIYPGLEYDPTKRYRYGSHALISAALAFVAFVLVEIRNCNWSPGIDLDRLQALHLSMAVFAGVLFLLSLFGIADFIFKYKFFFLFGVLLIYTFAALMVWMTYEAAVNPCVQTNGPPIDFSFGKKNVFSRGDGVGIVVLLLDIFSTIFMISAASNFYKRY